MQLLGVLCGVKMHAQTADNSILPSSHHASLLTCTTDSLHNARWNFCCVFCCVCSVVGLLIIDEPIQ